MKQLTICILAVTLMGCQNPQQTAQTMVTAEKIGEGVASAACIAERILLRDPILGDVCATIEEIERAKLATGSTDTHLLCQCILNERADARDGGSI